MKFGTWTYDSSKVNLKFYRDIQKFDLKSYVSSNEWIIIGNNASRNTEKYGQMIFLKRRKKKDEKFFFSNRLLPGNLRRFEIFH